MLEWGGGEPVVVAGNSLGGAVALRLAERADLPLTGVVPVAPAGLEMPGWFDVVERDLRGPQPDATTVGRVPRVLVVDDEPGLRAALGRVPSRGVPRIGALRDMSYGVRQFIVVDPGGNYIRIGQPIEVQAAARAAEAG